MWNVPPVPLEHIAILMMLILVLSAQTKGLLSKMEAAPDMIVVSKKFFHLLFFLEFNQN